MRSTVTRLLGRAAVAMSVIATLTVGVAHSGTIDPDRYTVLITGSNRGIGLAFAEYYTAAGWNVLATARSPEQATELASLAEGYEHLIIEQLDVTDNERIAVLAEVYRDTPIDLLINNAGVLGDLDKQRWGSLDPSTFDQVLAVNVFAPMKMAEVFAEAGIAVTRNVGGHGVVGVLANGDGPTVLIRGDKAYRYSCLPSYL